MSHRIEAITRQPRTATSGNPAACSPRLEGRIGLIVAAPALAHLGGTRLYGQFSYGSLQRQSRDEARASLATARHLKSYIDELGESPMAMQQAASAVDLAGKPLIVLTAGRGHDSHWHSAQKALPTLSTNSRHRVVAEATHASLV